MKRTIKWLRFLCVYCRHKTPHECLVDVQSEGGLLWRCERCRRSEVKTAHAASMGEPVLGA